jgi:hypothetical protein
LHILSGDMVPVFQETLGKRRQRRLRRKPTKWIISSLWNWGGATDIRNLWPEPNYDTAWNAHVKDQLEERLHEMVCRGDVDLATAQQDISKDWIAAYRKYFHTDNPIADKTSLHQL